MKIAIYLSAIPKNKSETKLAVLKRFGEGILKSSDQVEFVNGANLVDCDVAVMQGYVHKDINPPHLQLRKRILDNHKNVIVIDSNLFRPPYGRITRFQLSQLSKPRFKLKSVMWSVLSGDFDVELSKESCRDYVLMNAESGSIVVFHDSEKANERMSFVLPEVLQYFSNKGFQFKKISLNTLNNN